MSNLEVIQMILSMGKIIKQYRKDNDLTQFELAEKIGVSEFYISALERGSRNAGRETLIKLSKEMNIPIETLLALKTEQNVKIATNELYDKIHSLPEKKQEQILNIINYIIEQLSNE